MSSIAEVYGPTGCSRHGNKPAGWVCTGCKRNLCADCVAELPTPGVNRLAVCTTCGAATEPLVIWRARAMPFWQRLLAAPQYPLTRSGLMSMIALAAFLTVCELLSIGMFGLIMLAVRGGAYWSYMFFIIRRSADGSEKLGTPEFHDVQESLVMPMVRGFVATMIVWLPAAIYVFGFSPWDVADITNLEWLGDPFFWCFVAAGICYAPMALIAAATNIGLLGMLNPVQIIGYIRPIGRDYFVAVGALLVVVPFELFVTWLARNIPSALPIPLVSTLVANVIWLYPSFVMANILGQVLYVHGHALDWGDEAQYLDHLLPGAVPRGVMPSNAAAAQEAPGSSGGMRYLDLPGASGSPAATIPEAGGGHAPSPAPAAAAGFMGAMAAWNVPQAAGRAAEAPAQGYGGAPSPPASAAPILDLGAPAAPPAVPGPPAGAGDDLKIELDDYRSLPTGAGAKRPMTPAAAGHAQSHPEPDLPPLPDLNLLLQRDHGHGLGDGPGIDIADAKARPAFTGPAAPIREAIAKRQLDRAITMFMVHPDGMAPHLSADETFVLAAALAKDRKVMPAINLLKRVANSPNPKIAPRGLFLLARLYSDVRKDFDQAERMFRLLIQKYPTSREAQGAKAHLHKLGYDA